MTTYSIELEAHGKSREALAAELEEAANLVRGNCSMLSAMPRVHFLVTEDHEDFEPPTVNNEVV